MGFQPAFLPNTHNFPTVSGALAPADPAGWYKAMPASALFEPLRRFSGTGQSRCPDQSRCPLSPGPLPAAWRPARSAPHPSALPSRPAGRLIRIPALFHTISAADPKQQHRRPCAAHICRNFPHAAPLASAFFAMERQASQLPFFAKQQHLRRQLQTNISQIVRPLAGQHGNRLRYFQPIADTVSPAEHPYW